MGSGVCERRVDVLQGNNFQNIGLSLYSWQWAWFMQIINSFFHILTCSDLGWYLGAIRHADVKGGRVHEERREKWAYCGKFKENLWGLKQGTQNIILHNKMHVLYQKSEVEMERNEFTASTGEGRGFGVSNGSENGDERLVNERSEKQWSEKEIN